MVRRVIFCLLILAPMIDGACQHRTRPNIIYVLLDDAGYGDFGAFGSPYIKTPVFDRLCAEGIKFTQHYSGSAVCAPSRCVLMTGLHTGHCRIRDNSAKAFRDELADEGGHVFLKDEDLTVAEVLKKAGYVTGGIGKWGLGDPGSTGQPEKQGFDYWYGYLNQVHAHDHFSDHIWENGKMVAITENQNKKQGIYIPYKQEEKTLEFIRKHKNDTFFLYLAYTLPHASFVIPKDDPVYAIYEKIPGGEKNRIYAAMITRIDQTVGKVLEILKELGIDQDTIIFYTSDNGPEKSFAEELKSSGGLRKYKRQLYEGGIRAAMAVRWPGKVPSGKTSNFIWDMSDFFPTACKLAAATIPPQLDGMSVLPSLLGKSQNGREMHYWEIHSPFQQAVRMGNWKAIRFGTEVPLKLYDLDKDIAEENDLAADNLEVVKKIESFLATARTESRYFPAVTKPTRLKQQENMYKNLLFDQLAEP
jgi:arylsulfatase A-like enzyme